MYYTFHNLKSAYWVPEDVKTDEQCARLRDCHPNILWSQLQLFGQWLFERDIQEPEVYVALVSQRLRALNALERGNSQAQQLQSYTYDNLNRYSALYAPTKANPPDLTKVPALTVREQKIFGMWSATGLRKGSFASIRKDLTQLTDDSKFMRVVVPCVKAVPVPGATFSAYVPATIFYPEVFPVSEPELDIISRKLGTTSHGIRRGLALYLRRRAAELGLMPREDGTASPGYQQFKDKVNYFFGWTPGSAMWEDEYSKDVVNFINCDFMVHPAIEGWFTGVNRA